MSKQKIELTHKKAMTMNQALLTIGTLKFNGAPLDFLIEISENQVALEETQEVYSKTKDALINQYADKDKDGEKIIVENEYKMSSKNREKLNSEHSDLLDKKVSIELNMLDKKHFDGAEGLTPNMITALMPIINK